MALREGFFLLLVLVMSWASADARSLNNFDIMVPITEAGIERPQSQSKVAKVDEGYDQLCKLCENFTAQATQYLGENKTQTEIIETLHQACSELKPFKDQIHPEEFCTKFSLCQERLSVKSDDACSLCHGVVAKLLMKLQDPDTQFEVIKMLLQECNKVENYVQECKKMVLHYGPLILVDGEKFLESTDVCAAMHACKTSQAELVSTALVA
ncbi:uncharacterized protein LOC135627879 isoform X4 [Musa acuminata AAA Group]|uniref:uncharacterized protein LOC103970701 isoform X4 n=1 Tax=Musa acuminata AAA Group TaxID=214697 RepID=UPI0031E33DC3